MVVLDNVLLPRFGRPNRISEYDKASNRGRRGDRTWSPQGSAKKFGQQLTP